MNTAVAFSAAAGMLAAFNPCGFALLPGYLALFLGPQGSTSQTVRRSLVVAGAVTTGFVAVFGAVGAAVAVLSLGFGPWLSVVTLVAGAVLFVVGVVLITGRHVPAPVPRARLAVNGSTLGMVAYGVIYATVSLSCTLPVFIAAVVSAFAVPGTSPMTGLAAALAYAVGMGLVLAALALVVGLLGRGALTRTRHLTRHVGRASGVVILTAGLYVLWYGWVEIHLYAGKPVSAGPVTWVSALSGHVSQAISDAGTGRTLLLLVVIVAAGVAGTQLRRRRR